MRKPEAFSPVFMGGSCRCCPSSRWLEAGSLNDSVCDEMETNLSDWKRDCSLYPCNVLLVSMLSLI